MGTHRTDDSANAVAGDPAPRSKPGNPRNRRGLAIAMLVVGAILLLGTLWVGWRAYQAYSHLAAARTVVSDMTSELRTGGLDALPQLESGATKLADETAAAHSAVDDPAYRLATLLPWLGDNLGAVRDVAVTMDGIAQAAHTGLPSLAPIADHTKWASGGHFDLAVLKPAANAVIQLDDAVRGAIDTLRGIDRESLAGPVAEAVGEYGAQLLKMAEVTTPGAQAAQVVLPILGADGPRTYLVVFQNLAELRASGGIFGFYSELHAEGGTLTLGEAGSSDRNLSMGDLPAPSFLKNLEQLYSGTMTYPQNVNLTPDFPTAASLFADMYRATSGITVDGVIALDPVVASVLMKGVAPIDLGRGMVLTSGNAVELLLSGIYTEFPGGNELAERDALTGRALKASFSAILANATSLKPRQLIDDLTTLIGERRILVWSRDGGLQGLTEQTAVGGRQGTDTAGQPTVGVFLNDGSGGKMDYYLRAAASITGASCGADGAAQALLTITLTSEAPKTGLPPYVLGAANHASGEHRITTNVVVTGPSAGGLGPVSVDGVETGVTRGDDHQRAVIDVRTSVLPGQSTTVTTPIRFDANGQGGAGTTVTPRLVTTPMASPFAHAVQPFAACAG